MQPTIGMKRAVSTVLPVAVAGILGFGLAACGGSSVAKSATPTTVAAPAATPAPSTTDTTPTTTAATPGTTAPAAATAVTIHIKNLAFSPTPVKVKAGDTITVVNDDPIAHTLTANGGGFDSGIIAAGASATISIKGTGSVPYHCQIHATMKGVIQVS